MTLPICKNCIFSDNHKKHLQCKAESFEKLAKARSGRIQFYVPEMANTIYNE